MIKVDAEQFINILLNDVSREYGAHVEGVDIFYTRESNPDGSLGPLERNVQIQLGDNAKNIKFGVYTVRD